MIHWYVWHHSLICVTWLTPSKVGSPDRWCTWLSHVNESCTSTRHQKLDLQIRNDICPHQDTVMCVAWLVHVCDMTNTITSQISRFLIVFARAMTHLHVRHDSLMYMTHSHAWQDSFMCVAQLIQLNIRSPDSYSWHEDNKTHPRRRGHISRTSDKKTHRQEDNMTFPACGAILRRHTTSRVCLLVCPHQDTCICDMTHLYVHVLFAACLLVCLRQDTLMYVHVTWLIYMYTLIYVIWLIHTCDMSHAIRRRISRFAILYARAMTL